jgi:hypothetical protein
MTNAACRLNITVVKLYSDAIFYPSYILSYAMHHVYDWSPTASFSFSTAGSRSLSAPYYIWTLPPYQPTIPSGSDTCLWKIHPTPSSQGRYLYLLDVELYYTNTTGGYTKMGTSNLVYDSSSVFQSDSQYNPGNAFDGSTSTKFRSNPLSDEAAQAQAGGPWLYAQYNCR